MASAKNALAMCDICSFVYPHRLMQMNSYGLLVCPEDFEGQFDLKNHPQNKVPRPDTGGRNLTWSQANTAWGSTDKYWNLI